MLLAIIPTNGFDRANSALLAVDFAGDSDLSGSGSEN
jgi:hypothetical protein